MPIKKIVFFVIVIALLVIINNLTHSLVELWQKRDVIVKTRQQLEKEKKENQELKQKVTLVNKPQFVEEEARNKLSLVKPGEGVLVLPRDYLKTPVVKKQPKDTRPNWKKWLDMFF